ncbi:MAG: tetratricopeptide repeat protein [Planctomycetota bacterium]|jgi:hypothetical protein
MASHIILSMGIISFLVQGVFAAAGPEVAQKLNLSKTEIAGTQVYYEKCFEDKLDEFEKAYKRFLKENSRLSKEQNEILGKKEAIVSDINRIFDINEPPLEEQYRIFAVIAKAFVLPKLVLYLVRQQTTKDFLRAGGQLPDFSYDKATDVATYEWQFLLTLTTSTLEPRKEFELVVLIAAEKPFATEMNQFFEGLAKATYSVAGSGLAVHEVVEMSFLLVKVRPQGPYWRWFSDGLANALAVELLKTHIGESTAQEYADMLKTEEYEDMKDELNLKYWMMGKYCILPMGKPIEQEDMFTTARYTYSTSEVRRLIKEHGRDWITQLCNELSQMEKRTSKELFETIEKVTGEDMAKRLAPYQSFETRKEGQRKYIGQFNKAAAKRDYNQMLINLFRVIELEESQYSPDNLKRWTNAAGLLFAMGYQEVADEVMHRYVELLSDSPVPHGRKAALELFLIYSLNCNRPDEALSEAGELLESQPDNILALTVQMLSRVKSGQLTEAKEMAKKIRALAKNENSPSYKAALRVLAIEPDEPEKEKD